MSEHLTLSRELAVAEFGALLALLARMDEACDNLQSSQAAWHFGSEDAHARLADNLRYLRQTLRMLGLHKFATDAVAVASRDADLLIFPKIESVHRQGVNSPGCVYLFRAENGLYKIGASVDPALRLAALIGASPIPVEMVHQIPTANMRRLELALHHRYAANRRHGEWFALTPEQVGEMRSWAECPLGRAIGADGGEVTSPVAPELLPPESAAKRPKPKTTTIQMTLHDSFIEDMDRHAALMHAGRRDLVVIVLGQYMRDRDYYAQTRSALAPRRRGLKLI